MFESNLRIVSIDYLETSWVKCVVFLWKYLQISWLLIVFSKLKKKTIRELEKIWKNSYVFEEIDKSILATKS